MTPTETPFAQLTRLAAGDSLSALGFKFQDEDRAVIDRLLKVGAVTHRHDGHAALANPTLAPTVSTSSPGGSIPADLAIHVVYTLVDADGGETAPVAPVTVTTPSGYFAPFDVVSAAVDYLAGTLLAGNFGYGATVTDGAGGETEISPITLASVEAGHANAEVAISGLAALTDDASGSDPAASWRLWRQFNGGVWYLIATGPAATDTFTDDGVAGDCTVQPPSSGTTIGANELSVTVPGGQPADAVSYNEFASLDGTFTSPALLGSYPIADAGTAHIYTDLAVTSGAPPAVSTAIPGANPIGGGGGSGLLAADRKLLQVAGNAGQLALAFSPDGASLYVAATYDVSLVQIDLATDAIVNSGGSPIGYVHIAVSPDGTKLYGVDSVGEKVDVVDLATFNVTATIPIGAGSAPRFVAFTPDGTKAYVVHNSGDNSVSVIDATTDTVTTTVAVGSLPTSVAVTPDGTQAWVTNGNPDNTVSVIDVATDTVTTTFGGVGIDMTQVAFSPDGTYAAVLGSGGTPGSVAFVTVPGLTINSYLAGNGPQSVAWSADSSKAYVANQADGTISVATPLGVAALVIPAFGNGGPDYIAVSPDGARIFVAYANAAFIGEVV